MPPTAINRRAIIVMLLRSINFEIIFILGGASHRLVWVITMKKKQLALLIMIHFWSDAYANFSAPLMPLLAAKLALNFTLVGTLSSVASLASLLQPVYGLMADSMKYRLFTFIGPIFSSIFLSSVGLAPSFWVLALFILVGGLGVAAFHPQTAAVAGEISGPHKGLGVSLWIFGGSLGISFGPIFIVWLVQQFGLERSYLAAIPGLIAVVILVKYLPFFDTEKELSPKSSQRFSLLFHSDRTYPIFLLYLFVVIRTVVRMALITFIPLLLTAKGISLTVSGMTLTIFFLFAAIGGIAGGFFYDRTRSKSILIVSVGLAIPFLLGFFLAPWPWALIFLVGGGLTMEASNSVVVVMAQEIMPENASTTSSLVMGFGWGTAGLIMAPIGKMGDIWGLETTLTFSVLLLILALGCSLLLPSSPKKRRLLAK